MKYRKTLGILGGMGPEASEYLYRTLIALSIKHFGAKNNDDFPEIVLQSVPVPDFISNEKAKEKALNMLLERTKALNNLIWDSPKFFRFLIVPFHHQKMALSLLNEMIVWG